MDALAILRFLRDLQAEGRGEGVSLVGERLTDDPREFIKTDKRRPFVVKPIEEDDFVYSLADLRAAPRAGHPWALFLPAPDPPTATEAPDPNPPRPPTSGGRGA
jgi:hypothetical protein